jgi:LuxR family maltose regulon positive regulatory protein
LPDVLTYLDRQGQVAETTGLMWLRLKVYILQALAYHVLGDAAQAMEKLEQALPLAEPEGYIRIFVDEGAPMATVLGRMKAEGGRWKEYIRKLLLAFEESEGRRVADGVTAEIPPFHPSSSPGAPRSAVLHPLVEPLTPRELEVLRLMAAGHSNQEIAQRLIVSVGTVKKHLNNIFGKLNATSRTQAVARARELQLL